jgi:glycosyltransferase involved in cell wall biosynthesis
LENQSNNNQNQDQNKNKSQSQRKQYKPRPKQKQGQNQNQQKGQSQDKRSYRGRKKSYRKNYQDQRKDLERVSFKKISVLIPLYNEEESLKPLYNEIKKNTNKLNADYEVIFVDDGSTDKSLSQIKEMASFDKKIRYISFRKNYGKSAALQVGFNNVSGDAVITMDADLQDDPAEIPNLLKKLDEGYDLVSGWKKQRHDPFVKKHSSKFFNYVTRIFTHIKLHDFNCGLKAYRSEVVKELKVYGELHRYLPVLSGWKGFKVTEIPVKHHARRYGKTKFGISRFFKGFVDLITVIFTTRYIKRPMHLFGLLGALAFLGGIVLNAWLTYEKLFHGKHLGDRPLLFLGILLMIVGVQFFSTGLLGEIMVHNNQDDAEYVIKDKR